MAKISKKRLSLGVYPIRDIEKTPKVFVYELTIADQKLMFKRYTDAVRGLVVAKRNGHDAKITPVKI